MSVTVLRKTSSRTVTPVSTLPCCLGGRDDVPGAAGVVPLVLLAGVAEGQLALCGLAGGDAPLQVLVDHPVRGELLDLWTRWLRTWSQVTRTEKQNSG